MRINFLVGGEVMVQAILEMFTSEEKVTAMLANPIIELIFMVLMIGFVITLSVHVALFVRLRKIRNYLKETNRMDIEPLESFQKQFDQLEHHDGTHIERSEERRVGKGSR